MAVVARDADGPPVEGHPFPPSLYVRCDADGAAAYVDWGQDLGADTVAVAYALDDGPEVGGRWLTSGDHQAAGLWSDRPAAEFLDGLLRHSRLRLSVEADGGRLSRTFRLDGLGDASETLRTTCDAKRAEAEGAARGPSLPSDA